MPSYTGLDGSERSFALLLEHSLNAGGRKALLLGPGPLAAHLSDRGIETAIGPPIEGRPGPRTVARFSRYFVPHLRRDQPDVVWASGHKAALLAAPACRLLRVPLVWHKVDFSRDRLLARPLAAAVHGITAVSEAAMVPVGRIGQRRLLGIVPPPGREDLPSSAHVPPSEPTVGMVGRLVPFKGHDRFLNACALLLEEFPALQVVICGAESTHYPEYPGELRALAKRLGIAERVEFTGATEDVGAVFSRLTVLVSATYRDSRGAGLEGRGRSIIEASWSGVPVVATRAGGAEESVIDGTTGTLVEEAAPGPLADAIGPYLRESDLAARTGAAGRDYARECYAPKAIGQLLVNLLERVAT